MVKRLLIPAGVVILAVAGAFAAWKFADDSRRLGALTVSEQLPTLLAQESGPRITSPEGNFEVSVTDSGIVWRGTGGSINLTPGGVVLKSATALSVQGSGAVSVRGAIVRLCGSGGRPLARVGDPTEVLIIPAPPGPGVPRPGAILQGSPTVLAC